MEGKNLSVLLPVVVALVLISTASAATYTVGDTTGWRNPGGADTYATWAAQYNFVVGDILVFNFATGTHTVANVTKSAFDTCDTSNPLSIQVNGPATFTIPSAGQHYFICTVSSHCSAGLQKLAINASSTATATPPPSSVTPSPPTPSTSPSPPSPSTSPSPPSPSASSSPPPPPPPPRSSAPSSTSVATFSVVLITLGMALLGLN